MLAGATLKARCLDPCDVNSGDMRIVEGQLSCIVYSDGAMPSDVADLRVEGRLGLFGVEILESYARAGLALRQR